MPYTIDQEIRGLTAPVFELLAYEAITSNKELRSRLLSREFFGKLPSEILFETLDSNRDQYLRLLAKTKRLLADYIGTFSIAIASDYSFPSDVFLESPSTRLLYLKGDPDLIETPSVAIVGTRNPTELGVNRSAKAACQLVKAGYTIVSGLARGIDTAAHRAAIRAGGRTIAVIGTSIISHYPPENAELQRMLAKDHLVISQFPILYYQGQTFFERRRNFLARNETITLMSSATVVVEATDRSGSVSQARFALHHNRRLFVPRSQLERRDISWPKELADRGAVFFSDVAEIIEALS